MLERGRDARRGQRVGVSPSMYDKPLTTNESKIHVSHKAFNADNYSCLRFTLLLVLQKLMFVIKFQKVKSLAGIFRQQMKTN